MFVTLNRVLTFCTRVVLVTLTFIVLTPVALIGFIVLVYDDGVDEAEKGIRSLYVEVFKSSMSYLRR